MKSTTSIAAATLAVIACVPFAQVSGADVAPIPWPAQHTHLEYQFAPTYRTIHQKPIWFDYVNLHYRADLYQVGGEPSIFVPANQSSLWLNDTLYMVVNGPIRTCVSLDMGFAMMRPDWFIGENATIMGDIWLAHRYNLTDPGVPTNPFDYEQCTWTRKPAPAEPPYFDYFSLSATGGGYMMEAPSPLGLVINEYNNFTATTFAASDPIFDVPAGLTCLPVQALLAKATPDLAMTVPETANDAHRMLETAMALAAGVEEMHLPIYDMLLAAYASRGF